jgi:hypothetical protein
LQVELKTNRDELKEAKVHLHAAAASFKCSGWSSHPEAAELKKLRSEVDTLKADHIQAMKNVEMVLEEKTNGFRKIIEEMVDENIAQVNEFGTRLAEAERDLDIKISELSWYEQGPDEEDVDDDAIRSLA